MCKTSIFFTFLLSLIAFSWNLAMVKADSTRLDAATMKAALHTTTIEEGGFIDRVITMVNKGQLPADLVDSTFEWARKKPYKHRFQYFKQALIVRAASIGIRISS